MQESIGLSKFCIAAQDLFGKDKEASRRLCACRMIEESVLNLIVDERSRSALVAARDYTNGNISRAQLFKARKHAYKAHTEWLQKNKGDGYPEAIRMTMWIAYSATWTPFANLAFNTIISGIVYALEKEKMFDLERPLTLQPSKDEIYLRLAAIVTDFTNQVEIKVSEVRSLENDPELQRFYHPYINPIYIRSHAERHEKDVLIRSQIVSAVDSFLVEAKNQNHDPVNLKPLFELCVQKSKKLRSTGIDLLLLLAKYSIAAQFLVMELINHTRADVRLSVASLFQAHTFKYPEAFASEFLERAINDKTPRVRIMAAQGVDSYSRYFDAMRLVRSRAEVETSPEVIRALNFWISLHDVGYIIEPFNESMYSITVKSPSGCGNHPISHEDFHSDRFPEILANLQGKARSQPN